MNLKQLINKITNVNRKRAPESSLAESLFRAARYGDISTVLEIFSHPDNYDLINFQDKNKKTALMEAANFGQIKIVEALLTFKPNLDFVDKNGNNALLSALNADIMHQSTKGITEILLNNKVKINQKNNFQHNELSSLLKLYERSKHSEHAVYIKDFLESDFISILDTLLNHKVTMIMPPNYGNGYALLWAVEKKENRALFTLLKHGADIHFRGTDNKTALMIAGEQKMALSFEIILSMCKNEAQFKDFMFEIKDIVLDEALKAIFRKYESKFKNQKNYQILGVIR